MSKLQDAMADLDEEVVLSEVAAQKEAGKEPLAIISELQAGMNTVGARYEAEEYFLSELIMSAEIFREAADLLGGDISSSDSATHGTFLLGTIYGDIHDIGKNIVSTVMSSNGFKVIDLGVDVPTSSFVEAIKTHKPQVVGMSCLLTTAFDNIKEAISTLEKEGLRSQVKILIGGGPVTEATGTYVGADAVCKSAQDGVDYFKKLVGVV